jgi:hypothetical protein
MTAGKRQMIPAEIAPPKEQHSRAEVLARPSIVPATDGLYGWYFTDIPEIVPATDCLTVGGKTLLYLGIAPDKPSKPNSRATLRTRVQYHYRGNAEGSTLRRTLGVLLEQRSGFPLRRVGSGGRITLTHAGERYLDEWMDRNAFVAWTTCPEPWVLERALLIEFSCPLNLKDNTHHPFAPVLKLMRLQALSRARELPIADEDNQHR